jgi:hypothetical protein
MAQIRTSRIFDVIFVVALIGLLGVGYVNRVAVNDWFFFLRFQPSELTVQVAKDAGMSQAGTRLLYRSNPTFTSIEVINSKCDVERLGCLDEKGNVFILDSPNQHDQAVVTAAHEMLHLAYRRMPQGDKDKLAPLLDQAIQDNLTSLTPEMSDLKTEEDRRDEAHSLLGTEYRMLPAELETYYKQYFTDRTLVVGAFERSIQ